MADPIEPALTPERWVANLRGEGWMHGPAFLAGGVLSGADEVADAAEKHATAALALHGQPFGFTWEDVDLLEAEAGRMHRVEKNMSFVGGFSNSPSQRMRDLAARVSALLPPRP